MSECASTPPRSKNSICARASRPCGQASAYTQSATGCPDGPLLPAWAGAATAVATINRRDARARHVCCQVLSEQRPMLHANVPGVVVSATRTLPSRSASATAPRDSSVAQPTATASFRFRDQKKPRVLPHDEHRSQEGLCDIKTSQIGIRQPQRRRCRLLES